MNTNQIRTAFLEFFKSKQHAIIASDSLVPKDDPTVLFTTAGMQQFKPQFLGRIDSFNKASTCQKCLRTDDLDVVGKTDFHHTFFEMLGNFSFGDYFKKEAIHWAWEFLTTKMMLPKEKLWVSVYKDDDEAYAIWLNDIKMPADRIVKLGDKSNFWPSNARVNGPNGPCGPCSEIFYDYGVNPKCPNGNQCDPDCSCGRFAEVWNLVFTQFNRRDGGVLEPLPAKNIDTGMGLERLAAVVQGVKSNYDTDNFVKIIGVIRTAFAKYGAKLSVFEERVMADHMRAIVIGIADGVVPSNEGRGYVIRKLIVDITDLSIRLGAKEALVHTFVDVVVDVLKEPYPELVAKSNEIKALVKRIEEGFIKIRRDKVPELRKLLEENKNNVDKLGEILFLFRDTHGLPPATIWTVGENDTGIPSPILNEAFKIYESKMEVQKERSRASSKMTGDVFADQQFGLNIAKTKFVGYSHLQTAATVLKMFTESGEIALAKQGEMVKVVLDTTPFYAESGGQVGDTGKIMAPQGVLEVIDTQKKNDIYIHEAKVVEGQVKAGEAVVAQIDQARRQSTTRNHTATHLLQSALREVLGGHVKQQGSSVDNNRLRFDFAHHQSINADQLKAIESRINDFISRNDDVKKEELPIEEAKKKGALAFFAEKYGAIVRVVSIGNYSTEFCGGTHVNKTKEIEVLKIASEGSVAQGIRRIEAITGQEAVGKLELIAKQKKEEQAKIEQQKAAEKQQQEEQFQQFKKNIDDIVKTAETINGRSLLIHKFNNVDIANLRKLSDLIKQKLPNAALAIASVTAVDAALIVSAADDLVKAGFDANAIVKATAPLFDGSGGGKPSMAQAGSKSPQKLDVALSKAKELMVARLS